MQNIGIEFNGTYTISRILSRAGEVFYIGTLERGNSERESWSKFGRPLISPAENITIEKIRLKNDIRDYTFEILMAECEKFNMDNLIVEVRFNITGNGSLCRSANVSILSYKMRDENAELATDGLCKIKADIEAKTAAWYGRDGRLNIFLNDWRNYEIRKRIIDICDCETDPRLIEAEPIDFSGLPDKEIIAAKEEIGRFNGKSGADLALSAYKFGGARQANRIMDIFYRMTKYPVYILYGSRKEI